MVRPIHVSERFYEWIETHKKEGETMEEALRRLIRDPPPNKLANLLSEEQVNEAIKELNERDSKRLRKIRKAVGEESRDDLANE